jgi:hypothetical protein
LRAMSEESSGSVINIGLLAIAFIVLKLTGVIAWSWWWVLAPLWAPWAIVLAFIAVAALVLLVAALWSK